jgi:hypothetical protein
MDLLLFTNQSMPFDMQKRESILHVIELTSLPHVSTFDPKQDRKTLLFWSGLSSLKQTLDIFDDDVKSSS